MDNGRYPTRSAWVKVPVNGMRYPKERKQQARQRLIDNGGRLAKAQGFAATGMDAMAAASGVTSGSLYKHFGGKSDLFAAVIEAEMQRTAQRFSSIAPGDVKNLRKSLAAYLSLQHVDHPELGCALPSLAAEVARADESVRAAFQAGVLDIHALVKQLVRSGDNAWTLIAQNVGAVMLSRALLDEGVRRKLLSAVKRHGQALLERSPHSDAER